MNKIPFQPILSSEKCVLSKVCKIKMKGFVLGSIFRSIWQGQMLVSNIETNRRPTTHLGIGTILERDILLLVGTTTTTTIDDVLQLRERNVRQRAPGGRLVDFESFLVGQL